MADSKTKDDGSTLSFRPGRPTGAGGGSRLVVLESDGKDFPRGVDGPSLQPQWLKSPGPKDAGRSPAGPPGYPGTDKPRWGKDPPPARPFNKDIEWRKPGVGGADWEPEGDPNRPLDNRWRDEEREGGGQARAANGFRDRWQVDKVGDGNKWGAADGGGGHAVDHRRDRWGDAGGENRKWGSNRWDNDRDKEAAPPRNKWGPEPDRDGGPPPGPRAPPEDAGFRRVGNDPWRPTGRGRGGTDPPPTGFAIPPGGFARGRGRGRAPGFAGPQEQRPPIGAPVGGFVGAFWDHQTPAPERGVVQEQERAHRYSKETMLEVYRKVRGAARLKKPETTAEVEEIIVKGGTEPLAFIPLDDEDKSYYESIRKGEPIRPPPRNKEASEAASTPPRDILQLGVGRGVGQPRPSAPGSGEEKTGGDDNFFDAPALSAQRGAGGAQFERAAEARFADAERTVLPVRGREENQFWRRNDAPPPRKEDEPRPKEAAKPGDDAPGAKDWRSNRFAEEDRVWRKQAEDKAAAEREKRAAPATPPPKSEEPQHRADQASTWRKDESNKARAQKHVESAAHLLPDDLLSGGGKEEPAPELWEGGGEHENDEAYTEGGREQPALYWYKDPQGETQGPFPQEDIEQWLEQGFFTADLPVRRHTLPESAPFVPLGTALPHLKPKTPRMPPGYEHRDAEAGRTEAREGASEQGSRPGTGAEADGRQQRAVQETAAAQGASWQQNHVTQSQQVSKPQTPEQPPIQLHYPSLQTEPPKLQQQPQIQQPPAEPPFPPHFPGAPDLSFLHGDEPPKPQTPLDQFPLFQGEPQRPAEQPPKTERPPYFPHPAFVRPPPQQWPPLEHFLQPPEAAELPPWLVGARESGQKRPEQPPPPPENSMPFPGPILSAEVFAQMGGNHEQYVAYLHEQRELHARFFQQVHLQRPHSGVSQHVEGPAFPAGLPPHLQPQQQAHSLEQVEAEQRQRQREREEAERQARPPPPEQPPFLRGAFPPDILPPHMRFPGSEQHGWPPRPPFETPEQQFHQEMLMRQHQHEQNLRRSQSGGVREEGRAQPELPPFLHGVLPRERPGGVPPQEQSIPPELVQAVQDGHLPMEVLTQYLKSLGVSAGEGGKSQGHEYPPATNAALAEQGWTRGPMANVERQTMREEHPPRMAPGVENQGQMPPWGGFQNGEHVAQGLGAPQNQGVPPGSGALQDEARAQEFERMHQEHLEALRRGGQAPQRPWGPPQSSAPQAALPETGPSAERLAKYHPRFEPPAPKADGRPQWGADPEPEPVVVSLSDWNKQPEQPKTGPPVTKLPAQPPNEAPWTAAAAAKEKKSLLQIQMEEAERERAERARLAAEEAVRIAAGGYGANQSGASPWGGAGGGSRPKTLKEIQEEESRQAAERNAKVSQVGGGPVWGPSQAQGIPPVGNRMEKQAQLQARDTLAEQVIMNAAASAPQTPPPGKEEKRKRANETTPPVRTITAEEEAEFVEAGSGKKGKKKGAKGKQAAAASKPAPTPPPMQSASPWAVEAAATRPSLRQLAAKESAAADDTPPEYSAKSATGPSLADFLPGLHKEEKPQQAPVWNTNGGGAKRMTLMEIQEAERKEAERRTAQERARQAAMPRPAPAQAPSGAPWQRPTPPNAFFPPAAVQQQPANPPPKAAPAPPPHVDDDDDLFWDYGKDVTITLGDVPREPEQPAFPTLGGPPKPQGGGNWATPKAPAQSGYKQVATPMVAGTRAPASPADFPTLAPTGAAATVTGAKAKKKGAGAAEPAAPPAFVPATAKAGQEFRRWCEQWTRKLTGQDDLTLLDFCMTLPSASEAGDYISEYWGNKPEVAAFKAEFFKRRSTMPPSVLQADFLAGEAAGGDRHLEKTSNATTRATESNDDAQRSSAVSDAAGKKKGKKGKKVVDNSLLGFSVHSSRINMGTIESAADAQ